MHGHGTADQRNHADVRKVVLFIAALWFCVGACNVPTMMAHTPKNIYMFNFTYCGIDKHWIAPIFLSFSAFGYAVPLVVIGVIYVTIVRFLRTQRPTTVDQQRARERTSKNDDASERLRAGLQRPMMSLSGRPRSAASSRSSSLSSASRGCRTTSTSSLPASDAFLTVTFTRFTFRIYCSLSKHSQTHYSKTKSPQDAYCEV